MEPFRIMAGRVRADYGRVLLRWRIPAVAANARASSTGRGWTPAQTGGPLIVHEGSSPGGRGPMEGAEPMRRTRRTLPLTLALALLCLSPLGTAAQTGDAARTGGRVLTADGRPLPAATVEVWGRAVVHHVTETDDEGRFTLPDLEDVEVSRYVFRHLGLGIEIVQRDDFRDGMEIRLREAAYELEGIRATVSRNACPQEDQPEARELWRSAAAAYDERTSERGTGGYYEADIGDLSENDLFRDLDQVDAGRVEWADWPGGQRVSRGRVSSLEEVVREMGYAWERVLDGPEYFFGRDRHLNWLYPELESRSAGHFATPTFAELHTLSVADETDEGFLVRFCPRDSDRPWIRGTLLIGHGREMLEAEWRFRTGEPEEDAGGWVEFTTVSDPVEGRGHLLARRGLFYRHDGFEKRFPDAPRWYFRDLRKWTRWAVSPSRRKPSRSQVAEPGGGS